jgi:hypothetical protein
MTQLDLPHHDGTVERVRGWTVRVVTTRDGAFCGVDCGVRITHDDGAELIPGWRLCHMDLDAAIQLAKVWGVRLRTM